MLKAHSLLYAIYICLLVSIVCGAMIYFFNLYSLLNLHYNIQEELYIQNLSTINYALGNNLIASEIPKEENSDVQNSYQVTPYGLLSVLTTQSICKNDTITSAHFVGGYSTNKTALHIANFTNSLTYHGNVKIIGDCYLPNLDLSPSYITNIANSLQIQGKKEISTIILPKINSKFDNILANLRLEKGKLNDEFKVNDSLYFNSFAKPTREIVVQSSLNNIIIKGNFILKNNDSIRISKSTILEDVIVIAPTISIEEGFKGNAQFFATKRITINANATLNYPSVICLKNDDEEAEGKIEIKEKASVYGAVVHFGNSIEKLNTNTTVIRKDSFVVGQVYCTGKMDMQGTLYGSLYANKVLYSSGSSRHENVLMNMTIDRTKKPAYFIDIPIFEQDKQRYGIIKKIK